MCTVYPVDMGGQMKRDVLRALGDGGTMEMAEGVLEFLGPLLMAGATEDPFADGDLPPVATMELAGLAEVAELTGESKQTIGHWLAGRRKPAGGRVEFPLPTWNLEAGPVWDAAVIREFCTQAYPGDEPTHP